MINSGQPDGRSVSVIFGGGDCLKWGKDMHKHNEDYTLNKPFSRFVPRGSDLGDDGVFQTWLVQGRCHSGWFSSLKTVLWKELKNILCWYNNIAINYKLVHEKYQVNNENLIKIISRHWWTKSSLFTSRLIFWNLAWSRPVLYNDCCKINKYDYLYNYNK